MHSVIIYIIGILGSIPLSYGIEHNQTEYRDAGIVMMSVCGGLSYLINLIYSIVHYYVAFQMLEGLVDDSKDKLGFIIDYKNDNIELGIRLRL